MEKQQKNTKLELKQILDKNIFREIRVLIPEEKKHLEIIGSILRILKEETIEQSILYLLAVENYLKDIIETTPLDVVLYFDSKKD
jgi:hypothetical protein